MVVSSLRIILSDPESRGLIFGIASSIISSIITLYVAQKYIVQRASDEAAKKAIVDYKREFGIMYEHNISQKFTNWVPISDNEMNKIRTMTEY